MDKFIKETIDAGNSATKICLYDKKVSFCIGCFVCLNTHRCVIHDDVDTIAQKMLISDVLVIATPRVLLQCVWSD